MTRQLHKELSAKIFAELQRRQNITQRYNWQNCARPSQLPPAGDWRIWCIIAGRGFGKTRTGAETIKMWVERNEASRIALVGSTIEDVKKIMIEGESGILKIHAPKTLRYYPANNIIKWSNGAIATIHSADAYESLRGPQFDAAWIDELAKFHKPQETWDQLMMCMRLGKHPRVIVTTTPRPIPLLRSLVKRSDVVCTRGSTWENSENLSSSFLEEINQSYAGTNLGMQEINGEILEAHSLWKPQMIQIWPDELPKMRYIVIGVDPAITSNGNETGIITVGQSFCGKFFVLDDASGQFTPKQWSEAVRAQFALHKAQLVIAETNQGGEMVLSMLSGLPIKAVRATVGKAARATPIALLYEQGLVYHAKELPELSRQLLEFESADSPDRVDALVWAIHILQSVRSLY